MISRDMRKALLHLLGWDKTQWLDEAVEAALEKRMAERDAEEMIVEEEDVDGMALIDDWEKGSGLQLYGDVLIGLDIHRRELVRYAIKDAMNWAFRQGVAFQQSFNYEPSGLTGEQLCCVKRAELPQV